jgi:hypothetical protein
MKKTAFWLFIVVGLLQIGIGLRDLFAPNLFTVAGRVVSNSTVILDFAAAAIFLFIAFSLYRTRATP